MTDEELLKKITDVVVEKLGVKAEDVTPEATFVNDLGADSLDRVELVMASKTNLTSKSLMKMPKSSSRCPTSSPT